MQRSQLSHDFRTHLEVCLHVLGVARPEEDEGIGVRPQILVEQSVPLRKAHTITSEVAAPNED